jgi:alpha-1,3-glucan synthase
VDFLPFQDGTVVGNLFHPYENYTLVESLSPHYNNGSAPYRRCLSTVTMSPMGFKISVPVD